MAYARLSRLVISAAVPAMLAASALIAQNSSTIADGESGTNENNLNAYWFVYDDAKDGGNSTIQNATRLVDATYEWKPTAGEGCPQGTPGFGAKIIYQMGSQEPSCGAGCTYGNMVGIGTQLAPDGAVANLQGATKIAYWAKASAAMTVRVEVATEPVKNFAYHRTEHDITTAWAKYEIILSEGLGIAQPSWNTDEVAFDPTKVEKVQWQISMDDANPAQGTLWLDDITIDKYIPKYNECVTCVGTAGAAGAASGWMLSDMETKPYNRNGIGYYWYCYNDAEGRNVSIPGEEFSEIIAGANVDPDAPTKPILAVNGNGQAGNGAWIQFQLGPVYQEAAQTIKPFVGIGTKLSDNLGTEFYNADLWGAKGIYFDYQTSGDVDQVRLEVQANQTFSNAGIVHHVVLPGTGGAWKGATVKWSDLVLPRWDEVLALPPAAKALKTSELSQIQWAFQGNAAAKGTLAIDNVKMIDALPYSSKAMFGAKGSSRAGGVSMHATGSVLRLRLPETMRFVTAEVLDVHGRSVATASAVGSGTLLVPADRIAGGHYLVRLSTARGSSTYPLTIAK